MRHRSISLAGMIAGLAAFSLPALANTIIEVTGRIAQGSVLSTGPWSGVRGGDFVHMRFEILETSGFVLTTYPNGDIRRFDYLGSTHRQTVRGQVLQAKQISQYNPVVNVSNNAPGADGFFIFGSGGGAFQLIPVGAPTSTPATYIQVFELHNSTGATFSTSDLPTIPGTYDASGFDLAEWGIGSSAAVILDKFIVQAPGTATGSCCPGDGFCFITSQAACPLGGGWTSGGTCTPGLCPAAGACCLPGGGCVLATASACSQSGGAIYQGDDTACGAPACPPAGGCCLGNSCIIAIESACESSEGTWLGQYATCAIQPQFARVYQHVPPQPGDQLLPLNDAQFIPGNPGTHIPRTTVSTLEVTDTTVIQNLEVWVGMFHARLMDVKLEVTGPNGTTLTLLNRFGSTNACTTMPIGPGHPMDGNFIFQDDAPQSIHDYLSSLPTSAWAFGGRYRPTACEGVPVSLSAPSPAGFGGIPLAGTWTLTITDYVSGSSGNLGLFALSLNGGNPEQCELGVCCVNEVCAVRGFAECGGLSGTWSTGAACGPTSCPPTTLNGACCAGATCSLLTEAACAGPNTAFAGSGTVCNSFGGSNTTPCCLADYNHAGGVTVQDIFDFLSGYFTQNPHADINGGGVSVQDIFDYLSVYFSGC